MPVYVAQPSVVEIIDFSSSQSASGQSSSAPISSPSFYSASSSPHSTTHSNSQEGQFVQLASIDDDPFY